MGSLQIHRFNFLCLFQFMGRWFEVERSFYLMELASGCTTVDISKNEKGQIEVETNAINRW